MDLKGNHRQFPAVLMIQKFCYLDVSNFYLLGCPLNFKFIGFSKPSLREGMWGGVGAGRGGQLDTK